MKKIILILAILQATISFCQDGRSLILIHNYANKTAIDAITNPTEGNIAYDADQDIIYFFDGTDWVVISKNNSWLTTGNTGLDGSTTFLGHTDREILRIGMNNESILQIGRRDDLGLTGTGLTHYNDDSQRIVYVNGSNRAAIQFEAPGDPTNGASGVTYEPIIFSDASGNFRMKGPGATKDLFEIGSGGSFESGRLDIMIGGDGIEPITFKTYRITGDTQKELFRVQNSESTNNGKTRFGININPTRIAYSTVGDSFGDSNTTMANSTLQVAGSISKSIFTTTTDLTLDEDYHTIILGGNHEITLPTASTCEGRIYVIKNNTADSPTITSYNNLTNTSQTNIPSESVLTLQSDGTNWEQINNSGTASESGKVFYPPSIELEITGTATNETMDLHDLYIDQFAAVIPATHRSTSAPNAIPTYAANELYYYVTKADTTIFDIKSIDDNGVLTYDILAIPTDDNTILNIVFVVK